MRLQITDYSFIMSQWRGRERAQRDLLLKPFFNKCPMPVNGILLLNGKFSIVKHEFKAEI